MPGGAARVGDLCMPECGKMPFSIISNTTNNGSVIKVGDKPFKQIIYIA